MRECWSVARLPPRSDVEYFLRDARSCIAIALSKSFTGVDETRECSNPPTVLREVAEFARDRGRCRSPIVLQESLESLRLRSRA